MKSSIVNSPGPTKRAVRLPTLREAKFLRCYLDSLDWSVGKTKHVQQFSAFLRGASLGIPPEVALKIVAERIENSGGQLLPYELQRQQQRAYAHVRGRVSSDPPDVIIAKRCPKPRFSSAMLKRVASKAEVKNIVEFIGLRSKHLPGSVSSASFLSRLYAPHEKVAVFTAFKSQGEVIYEVGHTPPQQLPTGGPEGVLFLTNPVDGDFHPNPREGHKLSRRSEEAVTAWRYLVIESDQAEVLDWLGAVVQMPLRIVAIYTSGGRSIHCLVRLDAESKTDWDAKKNKLKPALVTLGADPGALTAVRLSRLPQCWRGNRKQELLFLNPGADGTPIMAQPERGAANEVTYIREGG